MDHRDIITMAVGLFSALLGWNLKELWSSHKSLSGEFKDCNEKMNSILIRMPQDYVSKAESRDIEQRANNLVISLKEDILSRIDRMDSGLQTTITKMWDKLESKQDKKQ